MAEIEGLDELQSAIYDLTAVLRSSASRTRADSPTARETPVEKIPVPGILLNAQKNAATEVNRMAQSLTSLRKQQTLTRSVMAQIDAPILKSIIGYNLITQRHKTELDLVQRRITQTQVDVDVQQQQVDARRTEIARLVNERTKSEELLRVIEVQRAETATLVQLKQREQQAILASIRTTEESIAASEVRSRAMMSTKGALDTEQLQIESEINSLKKKMSAVAAGGEAEYRYQSRIDELQERLKGIAEQTGPLSDSLRQEFLTRQDLRTRLGQHQSKLQDVTDKLDGLRNTAGELRSEYEEEISRFDSLGEEITKNEKALEESTEGLKDSNNKLKELTEEYKRQTLEAKSAKWAAVSNGLSKVTKAFLDLEKIVRDTQKQFGIAAGAAAQIAIAQRIAAVKSLFTAGPRVTAEEIGGAREVFQAEFGGLISTAAATELAKQAKTMGVTAEQLAQARRVFMTTSMGDVAKAEAEQAKFIGVFEKQGLTSKDAMKFIGQNTNLIARNGDRFATSLARAAADAKKIGVDLGKVDQIGDNIIGNFEGFLEKQAELGAMGFGFDTSRLAEVAATGDTAALFSELRSQLSATGKDITKLTRPEQLALSEAFGISMEDLQRMATGKTTGAGKSMEDLQTESNSTLGKILTALTDGLGKVGGFLQLLTGAISVAQTLLLRQIAINTGAGGLFGLGQSRLARTARVAIGRSGIGRAARRLGRRIFSRPGSIVSTERTAATAARTATTATRAARTAAEVTEGVSATAAATRAATGLARFGRLGAAAKFGSRILGKVALPLTIALSAFDAFKGFTADKDASFGKKLLNAGSSVISGLTFGLLGKDASEISAEAAKRAGTAPATLPQNLPASGMGAAGTLPSRSTSGGMTATAATAYATGRSIYAPETQVAGQDTSTTATTPPPPPPVTPTVTVDLSRLETKFDQLIRVMGSMRVELDGVRVGQVLVNASEKASSLGVLRQTTSI